MICLTEKEVQNVGKVGPGTLVHGDCLEVMRYIQDGSVDTIITDPPYGLEFMGKDWDKPWITGTAEYGMKDTHGRKAAPIYGSKRNPVCQKCHKHKRGRNRCECDNPDYDETATMWSQRLQSWHYTWAKECLRVAKPGAMLLAFGGTRTHHRLMCAIEDAGWEIRDCLMWLYGSGFNKVGLWQNDKAFKRLGIADEWIGWGGSLKPAWEPIIVAMKPRDGTFAHNALEWGVAGLWIDGSRIPTSGESTKRASNTATGMFGGEYQRRTGYRPDYEKEDYQAEFGGNPQGRWPANLILDDEAGRLLDEQSGESCYIRSGQRKGGIWDSKGNGGNIAAPGDTGGASRFFQHCNWGEDDVRFLYCPKASRRERTCNGEVENNHPTVKPLALMRYLAKLTKTPTGGCVLDPFMGSGTTGMACVLERREFIGIEKDQHHFQTARHRVHEAENELVQGSFLS